MEDAARAGGGPRLEGFLVGVLLVMGNNGLPWRRAFWIRVMIIQGGRGVVFLFGAGIKGQRYRTNGFYRPNFSFHIVHFIFNTFTFSGFIIIFSRVYYIICYPYLSRRVLLDRFVCIYVYIRVYMYIYVDYYVYMYSQRGYEKSRS